MSYDAKCDALARSFLRDVKQEKNEELAAELAQVIQDAIEEWLTDKEMTL